MSDTKIAARREAQQTVDDIAARVVGPASATDNKIVRWDLATGKLVQNSGVTIDDSNNMSGIAQISATSTTAATANAFRDTTTRPEVTTTAAIGEVAKSVNISDVASSIETDITNATVTITTSGRPVMLMLVPKASNTTFSYIRIQTFTSTGLTIGKTYIYRNGSRISGVAHEAFGDGTNNVVAVPPLLQYIDPVAAGTYTYKLRWIVNSGISFYEYSDVSLVAYEL